MRIHHGTIGLFALAAAWLATWPGHAAVQQPGNEQWAGMEEIIAAEMALADPDIMAMVRQSRQDEPDPGCQFIASSPPQQSFGGPNRYRGDVFRIEREVKLTSFQLELVLPATTNLFFSVHVKDSDTPGTEYAPVYIGSAIPSPAAGTPGNPQADFYSSGPLSASGMPDGIVLSPGRDYALGVAWGATSVIAWNSVGVTYPQNFPAGSGDEERDGTVRFGLLHQNFQVGDLPLPDDENFIFATQTSALAFSMQLCLSPRPGACCDALSESCIDGLLESECTAPGSYFHGERSMCEDVFCNFGACCTACGECTAPVTAESCIDNDGIQHWPGLSCPADPLDHTVLCPPILGACCIGTGPARRCEERCEAECLAAGGFYHGDGTTCDTDLCRGACCVTGGCVDLTPNECTVFNGKYKGNGTACNRLFETGNQCGGACCRGFDALDECVVVPSRLDCTAQFSQMAFLGDGSTCPGGDGCGLITDYGACCMPDGICVNTTADFCQDDDQFPWALGTTFNPTCSETGNPCFNSDDCRTCRDTPDDFCIVNADCAKVCSNDRTKTCTTAADCAGNSCVFQVCELVQTCRSSTLCPPPEDPPLCELGSCCFPEGSCEILTQTGCTGLGGVQWTSAGTCSPNTCDGTMGACCQCDGTCTPENLLKCEEAGGLYQGDGTTCPGSCLAFGACCRGDGLCTEKIDDATCTMIFEGTYGGNCTLCEDVIAGCDLRGQCCSPQGNCSYVPLNLCGDPGTGWAFNAAGDCEAAVPCVRGACCRPADETCERLTELACDLRDGLYAGDLTSCLTDCAIGACLRSDTVCEDTVEFDCTAPGEEFREDIRCEAIGACCQSDDIGACLRRTESECALEPDGVYQGDGTVCAGEVCSQGACCTGQTTCADDLFNSECAGEFYVNTACIEDPCPGACCLTGGGCVRSVAAECDGVFGGDFSSGSLCTQIICRGACCLADGTCSITADWECTEPGAVFTAGQTCDSISCQPRGACCKQGSCTSFMTPQACATNGGVYQGDGATCFSGRCDIGGCCHLNGTCNDVVASQCIGASDQFNDAATCGLFPCQTRGACCFSDGSCALRTLTACTNAQGTFTAAGTECTENVCDVGACCLAQDDACDVLRAAVCETSDGVFLGDGTSCDGTCSGSGLPCGLDEDCMTCRLASGVSCTEAADCPTFCHNDVPPIPCIDNTPCFAGFCEGICESVETCLLPGCTRGACCTADGACLNNVIESQCGGDAEDFHAGITCIDLGPACQAKRACCIDGTCTLTDQTACLDDGGIFAPNVTTCAADSCQSGACCRPDGSCVSRTRQLCENAGGAYQGEATACEADGLCHACCPGDGTCTDTIAPNCAGIYVGDAACIDEPCPGACCQPNGTCTQISADECTLLNGMFTPGTACDATCRAFGACCHEGRCTVEFVDDCAAIGGVYQGDGVACGAVNCALGACVSAEGSCEDLKVAAECTGLMRTFHPGDTCGVLPGACCVGEVCETLTRQACNSRGGTFNGVGLECTDNFCVPGACCHIDGTCDDLFGIDCDGPDDLFFAGEVCADITCDPRGACCIGESCAVLSEQDCLDGGGSWQGAGVACSQNYCVLGACCHLDGTCDDVIGVECGGEGDDFIGTTDCGSVTCPLKGACCDNGECTIQLEDDCVAFGGAYQGDGVPCNPDPCGATANVVSWESFATHGAVGPIGLPIPADGTYVEPRSTGVRSIVVTYDGPITAAGSSATIQAACDVNAQSVDVSGVTVSTAQGGPNEVVITFSPQLPGSGLTPGTHNPSRYRVELTGVGGAVADTVREFSVVLGDAFGVPLGTGDARVNAQDNGFVRSLAAQGINPINPANLPHVRADIFTNGAINAQDNGLVRSLAAEGLNGQGLTLDCP